MEYVIMYEYGIYVWTECTMEYIKFLQQIYHSKPNKKRTVIILQKRFYYYSVGQFAMEQVMLGFPNCTL